MAHLASAPNSPLPSLSTGGWASVFVMTDPSTYGFISKLRSRVGVSMPTSVPPDDTLAIPRRPHDCGTAERNVLSLFQRTRRLKLMPQVPLPSLNRIERKGICISTVQPPSKSAVRASNSVFQLGLGCSFTTCESARPPSALTKKP